jgi:hypothetical protein
MQSDIDSKSRLAMITALPLRNVTSVDVIILNTMAATSP